MLKRFLTGFGLMLLYMLVLAAVLLLAILLAGDNETLILITVLVMLVLAYFALFTSGTLLGVLASYRDRLFPLLLWLSLFVVQLLITHFLL